MAVPLKVQAVELAAINFSRKWQETWLKNARLRRFLLRKFFEANGSLYRHHQKETGSR
jgi:hypothetical protein